MWATQLPKGKHSEILRSWVWFPLCLSPICSVCKYQWTVKETRQTTSFSGNYLLLSRGGKEKDPGNEVVWQKSLGDLGKISIPLSGVQHFIWSFYVQKSCSVSKIFFSRTGVIFLAFFNRTVASLRWREVRVTREGRSSRLLGETIFYSPFNVLTATLTGPWDIEEPLRESFKVDNRCLLCEFTADALSLMMFPSASAKYTSPKAPEPSTLPAIRESIWTVSSP